LWQHPGTGDLPPENEPRSNVTLQRENKGYWIEERGASHPDDEPRLLRRMVKLAMEYGRYGYRRIAAMLREEGWLLILRQRVDGGVRGGQLEARCLLVIPGDRVDTNGEAYFLRTGYPVLRA